jgi:hypothetical protein
LKIYFRLFIAETDITHFMYVIVAPVTIVIAGRAIRVPIFAAREYCRSQRSRCAMAKTPLTENGPLLAILLIMKAGTGFTLVNEQAVLYLVLLFYAGGLTPLR